MSGLKSEKAIHLLQKHGLKITLCRKEVLMLFLENEMAKSQPEVEKKLSDYDRVTIYRTLNSFLDKGLIHKVLDDSGASRYALCNSCESYEHNDNHIHFKCYRCGKTQCLETLKYYDFQAPQGFQFVDTQILIQGYCPNCQ